MAEPDTTRQLGDDQFDDFYDVRSLGTPPQPAEESGLSDPNKETDMGDDEFLDPEGQEEPVVLPADAPWEQLDRLTAGDFARWQDVHGAAANARLELLLEEDAEPLDLPEDEGERREAVDDIADRFAPDSVSEAEGLITEALTPTARIGTRLRDEIHRLRELAVEAPADGQSDALILRAGALVASAKAAATQDRPFGQVVRRHQFTGPDGSLRTTVTDARGRTVEVARLSPQELAEIEAQEAAKAAAPDEYGSKTTLGGRRVTPEDVEGWSAEKWSRFMRDHPDEGDLVLQGKTVTF